MLPPPGLSIIPSFLSAQQYAQLEELVRKAFNSSIEQRGTKGGRTPLDYGIRFDVRTCGVAANEEPIPIWMDDLLQQIHESTSYEKIQDSEDPEMAHSNINSNLSINSEDARPLTVLQHITDRNQSLLPLNFKPNQVTIQHYPPGIGIPPHIDTHSCLGTHILSFSLASTVNMQFQRANEDTKRKMFQPRRCLAENSQILNKGTTDKHPRKAKQILEIPLESNSLCIMAGQARYAWTHGIRRRNTDLTPEGSVVQRQDRYSITLRQVDFDGQCQCAYPDWCDTRNHAYDSSRP
ncbi:hypothetical protein BJ875DRAFT_478402 [Amylocarpus encephaloides]|uniref:Fe2OG dioxygenase domain-containing protein n=1 Tax=Amylocarpus encephaloides TaxID=45428 RepID=A0A9P8C0F5_9HELO|nr:hypothetical protein BJ875DRAFT_478402 [Amylocarpus encephaloides]